MDLGLCPYERHRGLVVVGDVGVDVAFQLVDRLERGAGQRLTLQDREPALDLPGFSGELIALAGCWSGRLSRTLSDFCSRGSNAACEDYRTLRYIGQSLCWPGRVR